jgi:GNAT superfamily N-acetyltransferase
LEHDGSRAALRAWLLRDEQSQPWRAVLISDDDVIGHVQVTPPHPYLLEHLARLRPNLPLDGCQEIGKLFVDPQRRGRGSGRTLLTAARRVVDGGGGWSVLAVVETSPEAIALYLREGLEDVGTFRGRHGINHVFVDSASPNCPQGR